MKKSKTSRGFDLYEFKDCNGKECSLQKSSRAMKDMIWLGIDDAEPIIFSSQGWIPYHIPSEVSLHTRMHLDQKTVKKLIKKLQKFVETGEIS